MINKLLISKQKFYVLIYKTSNQIVLHVKFDDKLHRDEEALLFFTDEVFELFAVVVIPQPVVARLQLQAVLV